MSATSGRSCTIFCSGINPNTVLFILALFTLYVGFLHAYNWAVIYCIIIAIPYAVVMILYLIGGFVLLLGVMCCARPLIAAFPWIMYLCLVGNIVYDVMICIDQKCICDKVNHFNNASLFDFCVAYEYFSLGFIAGLNYVATFYVLLLVLDYLRDTCSDN